MTSNNLTIAIGPAGASAAWWQSVLNAQTRALYAARNAHMLARFKAQKQPASYAAAADAIYHIYFGIESK